MGGDVTVMSEVGKGIHVHGAPAGRRDIIIKAADGFD